MAPPNWTIPVKIVSRTGERRRHSMAETPSSFFTGSRQRTHFLEISGRNYVVEEIPTQHLGADP